EQAKTDARFFGAWKSMDEQKTNYYFFGKTGFADVPAGLLTVVVASYDREFHTVTGAKVGYFFTTSVGDVIYGNLAFTENDREPWAKASARGYLFVKCTFDGERLTIQTMNETATAAAIKKGHLKGTVTKTQVMLTDTTENLVRFLRDGGDKILFP